MFKPKLLLHSNITRVDRDVIQKSFVEQSTFMQTLNSSF